MSWFDKLRPKIKSVAGSDKSGVPAGLWKKCSACDSVIYGTDLLLNLFVCPKCGKHMRIEARQRLDSFLDGDVVQTEIGENLKAIDSLKFKDSKSGALKGEPIVAASFDFAFMGGSMGSVVGEKIVRGIDEAIRLNTPFVCFSASGGARMQESLFSLFQMSKTSAALTRLADKQLPFISVLTDPTMGGVSASFAMLGDVIVSEPKANIGFAGKRVIEQTVREQLPEGFQTAEFLLEHGAIDMIIDRREMRDQLALLLEKFMHKGAVEKQVKEELEPIIESE